MSHAEDADIGPVVMPTLGRRLTPTIRYDATSRQLTVQSLYAELLNEKKALVDRVGFGKSIYLPTGWKEK
jgi:hypothetical protein